MNSGIYCIVNLINRKKYIGQSQNMYQRKKEHFWTLNSDKGRCNKYLKNDWTLYGEKNFKFFIIEECPIALLDEKEIYWIKELHSHSTENGYNISWGGEFIMRGLLHSEETKKKMSENMRDIFGKNNPMFGKNHSGETKKKLSEINIGKKASEETKKKMGESHRGKYHSEESKKKMSNALKGKAKSEETKKKLSELHKGKKASEETKKKMTESRKGKKASEETRKKMIEARREYWRKKHEEKQEIINPSP
jgi:group I intron endonuclease